MKTNHTPEEWVKAKTVMLPIIQYCLTCGEAFETLWIMTTYRPTLQNPQPSQEVAVWNDELLRHMRTHTE